MYLKKEFILFRRIL